MWNIDDEMMISVDPTWNPIINTNGIDGVEYYALDNATDFDFSDYNGNLQLHTEDPLYVTIMDFVSILNFGKTFNNLLDAYCKKFGRAALDTLGDHINAYLQNRSYPDNLYGYVKIDCNASKKED